MLDNETYQNLIAEVEFATAKKNEFAEAEKIAKERLIAFVNDELQSELAKKDEPFGVVTIGDVKFTVAKKVEWDQSILETIWTEIQEGGDNPYEYMNCKYVVKEAAFKNWPSAIQNAFIPARTISQGNISVKVVDNA